MQRGGSELNFKYRVIMLTFGVALIAPACIIQGTLFTDYFMGVLIVYWGYLILFSNRYFASNSMFVQRFSSLKSLYCWYIKKELQMAAFYIILLDLIVIITNTAASYVSQSISRIASWKSLQWVIVFTILNIIGIVVLRLFMLWIQLIYVSYIATLAYCLYVALSALFSFISIPAIEIDFSVISPAFKGEFFSPMYLILSYMMMIIIGIFLFQKVKRMDRKL